MEHEIDAFGQKRPTKNSHGTRHPLGGKGSLAYGRRILDHDGECIHPEHRLPRFMVASSWLLGTLL